MTPIYEFYSRGLFFSYLNADLPLCRYVWDLAKSTTRAERLSCAAAILVLFVCILLIVYFTVIVKTPEPEISEAAPHEWYITRDMWLSTDRNNTETTERFDPLRLVIIAHTVSAECDRFANCAAALRNLQSYFIKTCDYDIPYNFLIGNDGRVYEGRGWGIIGAHTFGYNSCSMGLAFIGDYREGSPSYSKVTEVQLQRASMLFEKGVKLGYLHEQFEVLGAKDLIATLSPGTNIYNAIREWPNYAHENRYKGLNCTQINGLFQNEETSTVLTTNATRV